MGVTKDESLHLIDLVKKISDKIGVPQLKKHLSALDNAAFSANDEKVKKEIIKHVASHLKVKPDYLLDGEKYSHDETKYWGITYVCILLNVYLKFRFDTIALIFDMKYKNIYVRIRQFKKLDRDNKFDVLRLQVYDKIETELLEKKIITKKKN